MIHGRASCASVVALALFALAFPPAMLGAGGSARDERRISRFDCATRGDLLFSYMLAPLMKGDVADWTILGGLPGQVGDWITRYVDARTIVSELSEVFAVEGQPALKPVERHVGECAGTLGLDTPAIYVRNSPLTRIYAVKAYGRYHLVLTSGLLNLYAGRPQELKFVVGRELGHILCEHLELKNKSYGILSALQAIDAAVVPDKFQSVLPTLAIGRLFTWCRETEFTADRAGVLCCGEPKVAYEAIMRLQHGLNPDSPWIDPEAPGFDPGAVIKGFRDWQYQPFVKFLLDLKRHQLEAPYVPERLAMLKSWADTGAYREILGRTPGAGKNQLIEVVKIQAFELAPEGETVDPYVIAFDGDQRILRTVYAKGVREARWDGFRSTNKNVNQPRSFRDGQPLFFEIWDDNYLGDTFLGGFAVYPTLRDATVGKDGDGSAEYTAKIQWDWKDFQAISRPGYARVSVRFLRRQNDPILGPKKTTKAN